MTRRLLCTVLAVLALLSGPARAEDCSGMRFLTLGDLPGGRTTSVPHDISADGSVVVGGSEGSAGPEAFYWTEASGMVGLGDFSGGPFGSRANAVSADGAVIVGLGRKVSGGRAFRWTAETGLRDLGDLPGGLAFSEASGVSDDGAVVVGYSVEEAGARAFRWTAEIGMESLGVLPEHVESYAMDVSEDGSVVVGHAWNGSENLAFRWTRETGMTPLGPLPAGSVSSSAFSVSADGSVVVGNVDGSSPFRWTEAGGYELLPTVNGGSGAADVNPDGSVVVGIDGTVGFVWDRARGTRWVQEVLREAGVAFFPSNLGGALGVSADGGRIVGWAAWYETTEAWLAVVHSDCDHDGIEDDDDVCPAWPNRDQRDVDGNGIGDVCECGDQTGDGTVDRADILGINDAIFGVVRASPLCDTNMDGRCNVSDIVGVHRKRSGEPAWCSRFPRP